MIHHIKSLYADGQGQAIRRIAAQLKISRNTVRKYLRLDAAEISHQRGDPSRSKRLDAYRQQIIHQLQHYLRLSAVKVLRKLRSQGVEIAVSERTLRRYIESLRKSVIIKQSRYYMPVMDMVPGVQFQVDPGELRGIHLRAATHLSFPLTSLNRFLYSVSKPITGPCRPYVECRATVTRCPLDESHSVGSLSFIFSPHT